LKAKRKKQEFVDQQLVRALAHPLRIRILQVLNEQEASPTMLAGLLKESVGDTSYHTKQLLKYGCVELVRTEPRRGAIEHFFRAIPKSSTGDQQWRSVPRSVRASITVSSLQSFMDKAVAALEAGTIDDREDSTLNWMTLVVDKAGWTQVSQIMEDARTQLEAVDEQSRQRVDVTGQTATRLVVGLAAFEAAQRNGNHNGKVPS
jgi:DNA-binding transcriptional ArsR family regulator